jgi:hypothetical protein
VLRMHDGPYYGFATAPACVGHGQVEAAYCPTVLSKAAHGHVQRSPCNSRYVVV